VRGTLVVGDVVRIRMAVQAKRWKQHVQRPVVQQVRGSLDVHEQGLIITTSDFSKRARIEAEAPGKTPVGLMTGDELVGLLIEHDILVGRDSYDLIHLDLDTATGTASASMAGATPVTPAHPLASPPPTLGEYHNKHVTFSRVAHGDVTATASSGAMVFLKRAGFGGRHGYRLSLRDAAGKPDAEHQLTATRSEYARMVASMMLYVHEFHAQIGLPQGGSTQAEALQHACVDEQFRAPAPTTA
jgi:Restriction endonuclease